MKRHFITIIIVLAAMCGGASAQQKQGHVMRPKTRGVGKTIQAIGTAELMRKEKLIQSALIVCPTSLKYQWKREIERFTGQQAHVIEGLHHKRVTQYQLDVPYKIISYNSA